MTTALPTSFPAARAPQVYTTPPNSDGYHNYGQQHLLALDPTAGAPMNLSPTSTHNSSPNAPANFPNLPMPPKQLRAPKAPVYVPAALRPTDRPNKPSPLTPPRSVHGSTDSLHNAEGKRPMSRRSTAEGKKKDKNLDQATEDDAPTLFSDDLPEPTGPPARAHWKLDANARICDGATCHKSFGLFERRHHCRHCGNIFCNTHSHHLIPLDQKAEFNTKAAEARACAHCWDLYRGWLEARIIQGNSTNFTHTATVNTPIGIMGRGGKSAEAQKGAVASSVTKGEWNWSTF